VPERLRQPVPFVAEALSVFKRYKTKRALDLGCGVGRHCVYLAKNGIDVVGVDTSSSALSLAKRWAEEEKLKNVAFVRAAMTNIPFYDGYFQAVISVSVIHHALKADIEKTVNEIHRVLNRRGLFIANITSVMDPRYGKGKKIEVRTFRTLEAFEEKRFAELHHYFTKHEADQLLACFSNAEVEVLRDKPNYWKITAIK